jgi:hypothetical protein
MGLSAQQIQKLFQVQAEQPQEQCVKHQSPFCLSSLLAQHKSLLQKSKVKNKIQIAAILPMH